MHFNQTNHTILMAMTVHRLPMTDMPQPIRVTTFSPVLWPKSASP